VLWGKKRGSKRGHASKQKGHALMLGLDFDPMRKSGAFFFRKVIAISLLVKQG